MAHATGSGNRALVATLANAMAYGAHRPSSSTSLVTAVLVRKPAEVER